MKKTIAILIFLAFTIPAMAQANDYNSPAAEDNEGYMQSHGMVGIYGFLPEFHSKKAFRNGDVGGGAFVYYNLFNDFWGNVAIGVSSDYSSTKAKRANYTANLMMTPVTFNVAYMTSSDTVNFWGGVGASYTFLEADVRDIVSNDGQFYGNIHKKASKGFWAGDLFVGGEYIFTEKYKFGVFFEFRYTFTEDVHLKANFQDINAKIDDKMVLQRFRYTLGFAYHF